MWHAKMGEYCPEEGSINGVVRFVKVDKAYIQRNSFLPRQLLQPTNHKHHIGGRTVRAETTLFLRQDPHALTVLAEAANDDLQQYPAGVRYQRDAPIVAALCPIFLFVEYHDDGIFPLLRHLAPPPQIRTTISSSLRRRAGSPLRVILNSSCISWIHTSQVAWRDQHFPTINRGIYLYIACHLETKHIIATLVLHITIMCDRLHILLLDVSMYSHYYSM